MKRCSFIHAYFFELMKVVENSFKKGLWCQAHLLKRHRGNSYVLIQQVF